MDEHSQIELYVNSGNNELNAHIHQMLARLDLDGLVQRTLQTTHIEQSVMMTLLITDDESIRDLNKQYREQDKPTDVLSFPLLNTPLVQAPEDQLWQPQEEDENEPTTGALSGSQKVPDFITPPSQATNLGDVIISWPTLVKQANEAKHTTAYELLFLLAHGVLHLVGYDDQTESGYQAMIQIQNTVLRGMGVQPS